MPFFGLVLFISDKAHSKPFTVLIGQYMLAIAVDIELFVTLDGAGAALFGLLLLRAVAGELQELAFDVFDIQEPGGTGG
jgi:hypothetical protein